MSSRLVVACIQHACVDGRDANLATTAALVREAAAGGARLVLLQELHTGPYFCQVEDVACFDRAEAIPGPSCEFLGPLARELGIVLVASLFERRAPGLYHNTAVVFERDGSIAGRYRKMHIPDDPAYYEKFYFTPGDTGFKAWKTRYATIGVLVCWDQWYPEAARLTALQGAEILFYPTAIGWHPRDTPREQARQREAWITVQRAHAVANGVPVLVANRVGHEPDPGAQGPGIRFWGHSFVAGPQGEFIARAGDSEPQVLLAELDLRRSEDVRRIWPFLRDRRIDAYQDLVRRYRD